MWILGLGGLSRQFYFQLISVLEVFFFFQIPPGYVSKYHLNFMLVPEVVQHCQSNCIKQFFFVS